MPIISTAVPQPSRELREGEVPAPVVRIAGLAKSYRTARGELRLFDGLNLEVAAGEMLAIVGQSGAGKSTLLHIVGALDAPCAGTVFCGSIEVTALGAREAAAFRNREIGYVWQFHYLLPEFTAQENVALPLLARGMSKRRRWRWPPTGCGRWVWKSAAPSPGRTLWRRAAACGSGPGTGESAPPAAGRRAHGRSGRGDGWKVFDLIGRLHRSHGLTSILVTHNMDLAARCSRALRLDNGQLDRYLGQGKANP